MSARKLGPGYKLLIDLGPLLIFFVGNAMGGIFWGTGAFMAATLVSLGIGYWYERKLEAMPIISALIVLLFGGLTIYLHDDTFVKVKPTVLYGGFAIVLFGGLIAKRPLIRALFGSLFHLSDEGWTKLTLRWAIFFAFLAVLNEGVWRSVSTGTWIAFKVWGVLPLTAIFTALQTGLINRYSLGDGKSESVRPSAE